ncbi:GNAT family N-acetyltransferase [Chryseomicrobium palamuruense]|uniref:GNAT family N-acetyltransferase n=1 Tax=Chryseomicrobium palamuruense TaxID=682973 RepID=A0ABV8URC5_9BACL
MTNIVQIYTCLPDEKEIVKLVSLHESIFGNGEEMKRKLDSKKDILIQTISFEDRVIAYKIGYELNAQTFYSWLGGVDPKHRKQGLAQQLMTQQHEWVKQKGYSSIRTKTMNRWRGMLLLNIKNGFDVQSTYVDERGNHKIVLEKCLQENHN